MLNQKNISGSEARSRFESFISKNETFMNQNSHASFTNSAVSSVKRLNNSSRYQNEDVIEDQINHDGLKLSNDHTFGSNLFNYIAAEDAPSPSKSKNLLKELNSSIPKPRMSFPNFSLLKIYKNVNQKSVL